eukprot:TRINITY_DN2573_c0_g1_i2.p1 TRINITY_DN2573_c0_g1~~TRINITY_DN2573_c0_g1_i2.p1  ORF type:complete len:360 (-),score=61.20 TRINITY_DN2573_c0_g1_i2:8-1087(-)
MKKGNYEEASIYLKNVLNIQSVRTLPQDLFGMVNRDIAFCYLMGNDIKNAYEHYNVARKAGVDDAEMWYGIAIMYDKSKSYDVAESYFNTVLEKEPHFHKKEEIKFRLGVIHKNQGRYDEALKYFNEALGSEYSPIPLTDILFQIGHTKELNTDTEGAQNYYQRVLSTDPNHSYALLHLGWLHQQNSDSNTGINDAMKYILKAVKSDPTKAIGWYLLGRSFMKQREFKKAYDSYFEAIIRESTNAIFWSSVGILFYNVNQYIDALRAYVRAVSCDANILETWYNLGILYESCHQYQDAKLAYEFGLKLDPTNEKLKFRYNKVESVIENPSEISVEDNPSTIEHNSINPTKLGRSNSSDN